jgi:MFS family permease
VFRVLWCADTAAHFGTAAATALVPLVAVTMLHAGPGQMGLLTAAEYAAFLLVGLPAGAWIDRTRHRRRVLITADLIRALLYLAIPAAAAADLLAWPQLLLTAAAAGLATVFHDAAFQAYLPAVIGLRDLETGYVRLQGTQSISQAAGPGIGGLLARFVGAAGGLVLTGVGYFASAALLARLPDAGEVPITVARHRLWVQVVEGLRFVVGHQQLRLLTAASAIAACGTGAVLAVEVLFLTRDLGLGALGTGVLLALSGLGAVVGAAMMPRWIRVFGLARAGWLIPALTWPAHLLLPAAWPSPVGLVLAGAGIVVYAAGATTYNVSTMTRRQQLTPDHLRGRVNASLRVAIWGSIPLGALAAGAAAGHLGSRVVLALAIGVTLSAIVPAARSARVPSPASAGPGAAERRP